MRVVTHPCINLVLQLNFSLGLQIKSFSHVLGRFRVTSRYVAVSMKHI